MGNNFTKHLLVLIPIGITATVLSGKGDVIKEAAEDLGMTIFDVVTGSLKNTRYMDPPWKLAKEYSQENWMTKMFEKISKQN